MAKLKKHLVYDDGKTKKFWQIEISGVTQTVRFGKLGSNGQSREKTYSDNEVACEAGRKLIAAKERKGYVLDSASKKKTKLKRAKPKIAKTSGKNLEVNREWKSFLKWLKTNAPVVYAERNPPAKVSEIKRFEKDFGEPLPPDLRKLFLLNNGFNPSIGLGIFLGSQFHSISRVQSAWEQYRWESDGDEYGELDLMPTIKSKGKIQQKYFDHKWIPLEDDRSGIAIDMAPGPKGTVGQIVNYGNYAHSDERYVLAESITEFIAKLNEQTSKGNVVVEEDGRYLLFKKKVDGTSCYLLWPTGMKLFIKTNRLGSF
jgi:cell wall assembly regulator SMI1/predicted DNA-binding WGR domain protein